jgi:hypothetical protein
MLVQAAIKKDGQVYTGRRHCYIIQQYGKKVFDGEQGFVDKNGNFYDRYDAKKYAIECGQVDEKKLISETLISADLW